MPYEIPYETRQLLTLGIDLDGVIYDFHKAFFDSILGDPYYAPLHGAARTHREMSADRWDYHQHILGMSNHEFSDILSCEGSHPPPSHTCQTCDPPFRLFASGDPYPEVEPLCDFLLSNPEVHPHFITARPPGTAGQTQEWLEEFFFVPYSLTFTKSKTRVKTDLFIDDNPPNVWGSLMFSEQDNVDPTAWLLDRSWNQDATELDYRRTTMEGFLQTAQKELTARKEALL